MKPRKYRFKVGSSVVFAAPDGSDVELANVYASVSYVADQLSRVELEFTVDWPTWQRIDSGHWFHMAPEVRSPTFGGSLRHDDVEIEVMLDSPALTVAAMTTENEWELGAQVRDGRAPVQLEGEALPPGKLNPTIGHTESWLGLYVKQPMLDIPGLKAGFQTEASGWSRHADESDVA